MTTMSTFAGLPACANMGELSANIAIIGIPHGTAYNPGKPSHSAKAPAAIRRAAGRYAHMLDHCDEEGCGVTCKEAEISKDQSGWKIFLEGFMEHWYIGKTVEEAKSKIKKYASMGFGLG
jgi:hypothetical protein